MLNPSTGKAFATIPRGNASDIDKAAASAKRVLVWPWAQTSPVDSGCFLAHMVIEAGLPPGVLNVVTGTGLDASAPLAEHRDVSFFTFIGSPGVGTLVQEAAARHHAGVSLKLDGKSPHIVFADADLDKARPTIVRGLAVNAGQSCVAGTRVLIESAAYDRVASGLGKLFSALRTGGQESERAGPGRSSSTSTRSVGALSFRSVALASPGTAGKKGSRLCASSQRSRLSLCRPNIRAGSRHHKHQGIQGFLFVFQCRGISHITSQETKHVFDQT